MKQSAVMRIAVFCGANTGANPNFTDATRQLGRLIGTQGHSLVYGGGRKGLMGVVADAVMDAGGSVTGVVPDVLKGQEMPNRQASELIRVPDMHTRKARMIGLADAFIALPGGIGTLEEFLEVWAWFRLGIHKKPYGLLDVDGYFAHFLRFIDQVIANDFMAQQDRDSLLVSSDPGELLGRLFRH
jgi:uncharacterized protein (TIGR00730 family)